MLDTLQPPLLFCNYDLFVTFDDPAKGRCALQDLTRRDGRVVEGARLESVYTLTMGYRGFESLSLRK